MFTKQRKDVEKDGKAKHNIMRSRQDRRKFLIIIQIIAGRLETAKNLTMGEVRKLTTTKRKLYNEVETKYMIYGCRASLADERKRERERESERGIVTINLAP